MTPPEPSAVSFLDDDGNELPDEVDTGDPAPERADRRRARVEQWLPDGGGAAITGLVLVLVAWLGATPLVQSVTFVVPQGSHRIGELTEDSLNNFGGGEYYGVTPGLIPVISFGTRAVLVLIALVLGFRARRRERSSLATAAVTTSSLSLLLFVVAAVLMGVGLALGHNSGYISTF